MAFARVTLTTIVLAVGGAAAAAAAAQSPPTGGAPPPTSSTQTATAPTSSTPAPAAPSAALRLLDRSLNKGMQQAGSQSSAYVIDLKTGDVLYSRRAGVGRLPASVEKLYTTTTALQRFGPGARLTTAVLGSGRPIGGTYSGTLYLRGGGDPTFGSTAFDNAYYGPGRAATIQQLVANLVRATRMRALSGRVVADESLFDSDRGTPATGNRPSIYVEGELSALSFDRGWSSSSGTAYFRHPALQAGNGLVAALRGAGIRVSRRTTVRAGATPPGAITLATVQSPTIAQLVAMTNTPSDNFFAETLLKNLGARFGGAGTTAAGAAIVRAQIASKFGIKPRLNDGSGLSYYDRTSPIQVVTLLRAMAGDADFIGSLPVAGETGTLQDEMRGTYAEGRCRAKTGTLNAVSNMAGYCVARDGHTLAFALLMNGIDPDYAHPIQDRMVVSLARYDG
ncbi:MAG: D-alanyl-D-alanine carboxypeptidase/D-alanyl-D-alanine endopeptidase [Solirubrobacteraceae bacterium]